MRSIRSLSRLARRTRDFRGRNMTQFLRALLRRHRIATLRAVLDGAVVALTLKRSGLRPLLRDNSGLPDADPEEAIAIAQAVDAGLLLLPVAPTCLRRSVTLLRELHRRKTRATLHIGVRNGGGGVEAHAWVQVADIVINDDERALCSYIRLSAGEAERLLPRFT